uniref:Uncharacterized protein n=1 Tax=Tetradesmus obliquus TaxID=3088 RepID=A0A383WHX5_TETOB|eukprot:jgi/Sobl393_1/1923/SZX76356.1
MRRSSTVLVLLCALAVFGAAVHADDEAGEACACKPEELQNLRNACQVQASELQKHIETLKGDLSASNSKGSSTQQELATKVEQYNALQAELVSFQQQVASLQEKLSAEKSKAAQAQAEADAAKQSAAAVADQGSSCKRTLSKVESQLSEQAARLAELKAVEDAYLPVWLSRHVDTSVKYASESWQQVQESEYTAQVVSTVKPHWEWLKQATAPAQEALSKLPIADYVAAANVHLAAAKVQVANIEAELKTVVKGVAASQPALSALNDPVALQLAVYSIMGLPMLLLFVVFVSIYGGPGKSSGTGADSGSKAAGKKASAAAAAAGKKGAAAGSKAKAAVTATPAGKGKGKAVRDGADVLYTP